MWKSTATNPVNAKDVDAQIKDSDSDWDSDPLFVNDISERDQKWGRQKTIPAADLSLKDLSTMAELRRNVINNDKSSNKNWEEQNNAVKKSYMTPTTGL